MSSQFEQQADSKILKVLTEVHGERKESLLETKEKVYTIAKEHGVEVKPIYDFYIDAGIAFRNDNYEEAISSYEKILTIIGDPDTNILYSYTCVHMGTVFAMQGQFHLSQTYFTTAEKNLRYVDKSLALLLNVNISGTYIQLQDYQSSINHCLIAISVAENKEACSTYCLTLANLGFSYAQLGLLDKAQETIEEALRVSDSKQTKRSNIYAHFYQAVIHHLNGKDKLADDEYQYALEQLTHYSDSYMKMELFESYSRFLLDQKNYHRAIKYAQLMLDTPYSFGDKKLLAGIYKVIYVCYHHIGDVQQELKYLRLSNEAFEEEIAHSRIKEAEYVERAVVQARSEQKRKHLLSIQEHLTTFSSLSRVIARSESHSSDLLIAADKLNHIIPFSMIALAVYDAPSHTLEYKYIINNGDAIKGPVIDCHVKNKLGVYCAVNRKTVVLDTGSLAEVSQHLTISKVKEATLLSQEDNFINSVLYVPIELDDQLLGVLTVQNTLSHCYTDLHVHLIEQLANYIAISIKNQQQTKALELQAKELNESHQRLEHLYRTDHLTGLLNRHALHEDSHKLSRKLFSSILIDIDDYKHYNDNYGHVAGDKVLVQLAKVFLDVCRSGGSVYRIGGDEFLIILSCQTTQCAFDIASSIKYKVQQLKIAHAYSTVTDRISCTFGIHTTMNQDTVDLEKVLYDLDIALYEAKRAGRDAIAVYNADKNKTLCI